MTIDLSTTRSITLHSHYPSNIEIVVEIARPIHSSAKARHLCVYENMASVTEGMF